MAVPFGGHPMLEQFLEWAEQNGCKVEFKVRAHSRSGQPFEVLEIIGPQGGRVVLARPDRTERLTPSQVANMHRRIGVKSEFAAAPEQPDIALNNFLASFPTTNPPRTSWPQFVHTYSNGVKETLLKLASPLEVFGRMSPPSSCTPAGTCTWDSPPPDLCGFTGKPQGGCSLTPNAPALLWPSNVWTPIQILVSNWGSHAGSVEAFPSLPPGTCGLTPAAGTFCAAIMDVKQLLIRIIKGNKRASLLLSEKHVIVVIARFRENSDNCGLLDTDCLLHTASMLHDRKRCCMPRMGLLRDRFGNDSLEFCGDDETAARVRFSHDSEALGCANRFR